MEGLTERRPGRRPAWLRIPGLSPGLLVALLALVLTLGGTSYAAFRLGAGSVGTKELKDHAVTSGKLADRAVTSGKLADRAVTSGKLAPGTVTSGALGTGAVTSQKIAPGAVGTQQIQAGAGVTLSYQTSQRFSVDPGRSSAIYQSCPPSMNAIGGGVLPDDFHVVVDGTGPYQVSPNAWGGPASAWAVWVTNNDSTLTHTFVIFAVCTTASSAH